MKKLISITTLALALCFTAFAQTGATCPEVTVQGPSSLTKHGEEMQFYALVGNRITTDFQYRWDISAGTIISGQGTSSITVATDGLAGQSVTASVKISGLATGCKNETSETGSVAQVIQCGLPLDEFGAITNGDVRGRLDNFFIQLQNDPTSEGLVEIYLNKTGKRYKELARLRLIENHLSFRKFDPARLTFAIKEIEGEGGGDTRLWIVPKDATLPAEISDKNQGFRIIYGEYLKIEISKLITTKKTK